MSPIKIWRRGNLSAGRIEVTRQTVEYFKSRCFTVPTQLGWIERITAAIALLLLFSAQAASELKTVLFLGDSITAGYGLDPAQAYPALIQEKIAAEGWNYRVINAGQSGDTSSGGLSRLDWLLKNRVDVLVLELGGNDGLRGIQPGVIKKNLQAIIDRTREKYPAVKVVIAGMKMPPNMGGPYARQFEAVFPDLARKNRASLIPFLLEDVGGVQKLNLPDGIHPTANGHEIIASNAWKVLEPLLRSLK
jgi:acyl-CoA thioesterase-1